MGGCSNVNVDKVGVTWAGAYILLVDVVDVVSRVRLQLCGLG